MARDRLQDRSVASRHVIEHRSTRRQFLGGAVLLGLGAAALTALGPRTAQPAGAGAQPPARLQVLVEDLVETTEANFARGVARGVEISRDTTGVMLRGERGGEFLSGPLRLPFAATHLGLHWILRNGSPDMLAVEVRTSDDGGDWSTWQPVTVEAVAEAPGGQEIFAALVAGERRTQAQYRVAFKSEEVALSQMTVTTINAVDGQRVSDASVTAESSGVSLAVADGTSLSIMTRAGWGCDESLRFRGKTERWPEMYVPAKKVVLHHTATTNAYVDGAAEVRAIYTYHARTLGWGDIGYNLLIDKTGAIYEGRHGRGEAGSREIASADVVAGHVLGHNYGSTGIAVIGNSSAKDWVAASAMFTAIEDAVTFECGRHYLDPGGESDFLKSDGGWHEGLDHCSGHSDSYTTECPGSALKVYLPTLRTNVATRLKGGTAPQLTGTKTGPNTLDFTWSSDVNPWPDDGSYLYCLEGWHKPTNSEDITYLSGYQDQSAVYGDPLAKGQAWTETTTTAKRFTVHEPGHYTMHLRTVTGTSADRYEANLTFLIAEGGGDAPPSVALTQPAEGAIVTGTITLAASAGDDVGVSQVAFSIDGWLLGTDTSGTDGWSIPWDTTNVTDGPHTVTATATDTSGQTASHMVSLTVTNGSLSSDRLHIGDLDATSSNQGSTWTARVTISVHNGSHEPVGGALIRGTWSGGASLSSSGTTDAGGTYTFEAPKVPKKNASVTFTVEEVSYGLFLYAAGENHDPDSDSNGTSITVTKP